MEMHPVYEGQMALKIQTVWRRKFKYLTSKRIVDQYLLSGPTITHIKSISFESLVVLLREKPIISVTKACLQRIHLLSTFRHGSPSKALSPENVNVRVFLAGFMIAYRPTHVFESMGVLEIALLEAATPLIAVFEKICRIVHIGGSFMAVSHELTKDFPTLLFEFLKRFKAWKVPDEAKLTCRIKHALIALYQAQEHLPYDEPEDSKLKTEFRTQIERLSNKLQQIAGTGELKKFEDDHRKGIIPGGKPDKSGGGGAYAALPGRMTNEQLAHELLLDPTFQLDESGGCSVENPVFHRIRESFHQAFWDSLVDDLRLATPCYVRVLRVLAEIRDGINDLAGSREAGCISEAVDLDYIKQQAEAGLYKWNSCTALIASIVTIVQRVQAPKRDGETKEKWKEVEAGMCNAMEQEHPRAFCRGLEFLLDRVNAMRIDAANARLRLIAPVIKDHGVDYERGKFQDKVTEGTLTLQRTTAWIRLSLRREVVLNAVRVEDLVCGTAKSFVHVHAAALLSLVCDNKTIALDICPETLTMDVHRVHLLQREFQNITTAATMMITATHSITASKNAADLQVLSKICDVIDPKGREIDLEATVAEVGVIAAQSSLSSENRATMLRALVQCSSPTDAVHQLIGQRVRSLLSQIMETGKLPGDVKFINAAKILLPKIDMTAAKIMSLANLNRTVHLPTYNSLICEQARALDAELKVDVKVSEREAAAKAEIEAKALKEAAAKIQAMAKAKEEEAANKRAREVGVAMAKIEAKMGDANKKRRK